jgi:hypothetical protein
MITIRATVVDLSGLEKLGMRVPELKGVMSHVVLETGDEFKQVWSENARGSLASPGSYMVAVNESGEYPYENDPLKYFIAPEFKKVRGDKDVGILMEYGFEPFDMKKVLGGKKSKVIAFSFFKEGMGKKPTLPNIVYQKFQSEQGQKETLSSSIIVNGVEINPINSGKARDFVLHGQRRTKPVEWKKRKFQGLRQESTGYKTFRTMSVKNTNSWIHPGVMPKRIFGNTVRIMKPRFYQKVQTALDKLME